MKTSCVTLEDVLVAASIRAASLVPETSGYLTLAIADATSKLPLGIEDRALLLTTEGSVTLARRGPVIAADAAAAAMRDVLARLLVVSAGSMPGLANAARPRAESDRGVEGVVAELEAALIPVNRAAARRALARLARETSRAREMGKIAAVMRKAPAATLSRREMGNTLVGVAPQPATVAEAPAPSMAPAAASVDASPDPVGVVLGEATAAPSPAVSAMLATALETRAVTAPAPEAVPGSEAEDEPEVIVEEPFAPTPTALGMSVWMVEEPGVAAPSPRPMPTALETAPWTALDDAALARIDQAVLAHDGASLEAEPVDVEPTSIETAAEVITVGPPPVLFEPLPPPECSEEPPIVWTDSPAAVASVAPPAAVTEPACAAPARLDTPPHVGEPAQVEEQAHVEEPAHIEEQAHFEEPEHFGEPVSARSESPVLELYVEELPSLEAARLTLPWPVFNGEAEPDPMLVEANASQQETVPMPLEVFSQALAASALAADDDEFEDVEDQVVFETSAPPPEAPVNQIEGALGHDVAGLETPYVFELLRRAARVSAPPPMAPQHTRADDLLASFTAMGPGDDQSLRAAASSLKSFVGIDATPFFALPVTSTKPAAHGAEAAFEGARPSAPPAFVVPRGRSARRFALAIPLACFALGILAATALVSALRPELLSDVAGRLGTSSAVTAPQQASPTPAEKAPAANEGSRRPSTRAERDDKPASRPRAGSQQ